MRLEYFQMIDRIEEVGDDRMRLVAKAHVPAQSPIFEGHFPGHPLMPGVLLIETMAQTAGYLLLMRNGFSQMPFLVGVRDAKLRSFVAPDSELTIEAVVDHEGSGYTVSKASIRDGDARACNAELMMRMIDFPTPVLAKHLRDHARAVGMPGLSAS